MTGDETKKTFPHLATTCQKEPCDLCIEDPVETNMSTSPARTNKDTSDPVASNAGKCSHPDYQLGCATCLKALMHESNKQYLKIASLESSLASVNGKNLHLQKCLDYERTENSKRETELESSLEGMKKQNAELIERIESDKIEVSNFCHDQDERIEELELKLKTAEDKLAAVTKENKELRIWVERDNDPRNG